MKLRPEEEVEHTGQSGPRLSTEAVLLVPITEPQSLHDIQLPAPFHFQCSHLGSVTGTLRNALLDGFILVQTSEQI